MPDSLGEVWDVYRIDHKASVLAGDEPPEKYVTEIETEIVHVTDEEGDPSGDVIVGKLDSRLFHIDEWIDDDSPYAIEALFDLEDEGIYWFYARLFEPETDGRPWDVSFRKEISGQEDTCFSSDLLLLHSMTIEEPHRGKLLGLQAIRETVRTFARMSALSVLKAFPLKAPDDQAEATRASKELQRYYSRIGFEPIGKEGLMVCHPGALTEIRPRTPRRKQRRVRK